MSAPRDLVAEARALAVSCGQNAPGRALAATLTGLADEIERLRTDLDKVRAHIDQRPEYITACLNAGPNSAHDYYRWQGGAKGRRQLAQDLGWTVPYEPGEKTGPKDGGS